MNVDLNLLKEYVDKKLLSMQKHPVSDLYIFNYTAECQYSKQWDDITLMCRGLIVDNNGKIVARPFKKFFNLEETESVPNLPFRACEKMDGSLGILYWLDGKPCIATRGSFLSEQAKFATGLLHTKYADKIDLLNPDYTYLFEIIYPENRIVVNYGNRTELVLLAIIDTNSGEEIDIYSDGNHLSFPVAKWYVDLVDVHTLSLLNTDNAEGFVVRFDNGTRIKVKFEEYKRLHRLLTGINERDIWEVLKSGGDLQVILNSVPDEFYTWVNTTADNLNTQYSSIDKQTADDFAKIEHLKYERKEFALAAQKTTYPAIMFSRLDNKNYQEIIWKLIYPKEVHTFKVAEL